MDKYIYNENNGLWYKLQDEYYLPCLTLPPEEEKPIGIVICNFSLNPIDKGTKSYYNPLCKYDFILLEVQHGKEDL